LQKERFMETSESKLKVCYIITLPNLGGAQTYVKILLENAHEYSIEPTLITGGEGWLTEQSRRLGIRIIIVNSMVREISPRKDIIAIWQIYRQLKTIKPDIVHCNSSKAGIVGRVAAKLAGIPAVFTAHGWAFTEGVAARKRRLYRTIENIAGYLTKQIICVSEYDCQLGKKMIPAHAAKMVTIHNAILDNAPVHDWQSHPLDDTIHCVTVARFSPPKKNIQLLRLFRKLLDSGIKATITFIGDGPNLPAAKTEAERLNLGDAAIFLGARDDVPSLLPGYDIFILLSNWEGFPISILEAMRAGLPVIASDVGGVKEEIINGKTGWLMDADETGFLALFQRIARKTIDIPTIGRCARQAYLENFTTSKMMEQTCRIYSGAIDRR